MGSSKGAAPVKDVEDNEDWPTGKTTLEVKDDCSPGWPDSFSRWIQNREK